ncbi:ribonuclease H-like domain-containing protein [Bisporella sp. PMI_857]|nr:ribonuclease H-like domain-containing protein [Bisporella sp. PMI_857]
MVYRAEIYVDGGCRNNGHSNAIGAAACVFELRWGRSCWTRRLPAYPRATNQRAEITAIIMALEQAQETWRGLDRNPRLKVRIHSDSRYAIGCMTEWIYKWRSNGWRNAAGREVANKDLIEEADELDTQLRDLGHVEYIWVPREENQLADRYCNKELDEMEAEDYLWDNYPWDD